MQDPRLRYLSAAILSLAAFSGNSGALAAAFWLLLFGPRKEYFQNIRLVLPICMMVIILGLFSYLTGGVGLDYIFRMIVIILIGLWLYLDHRPGDFANTCVYCTGNRIGFDLGLIGEMAIQTLSCAHQEFFQVQRALRIKGQEMNIRNIVPIGRILLFSQISRAENQTILLASRGYVGGGTRVIVFNRGKWELAATVLAILVGFFPVLCREFFILPH